MLMKFCLMWVNTMSIYYGMYDYARYFKVRHARVIEDKRALEAAYNVRLGQRMVPLDTKIGEALLETNNEAPSDAEETAEKIKEKFKDQ